MAVIMLNDGRWICYYRVPEDRPEKIAQGQRSRLKKEYFGRGPEAEAAARIRDEQLELKKRRPRRITQGPLFSALAEAYTKHKNFNVNSRKHLIIRLNSTILPFFGLKPVGRLTDQDLDDYVAKRRRDPVYNRAGKIIRTGVKNSTIARELTDVKAILNWAAGRKPPMIPFNPVASYKKPDPDDQVIPPPTAEETAAILAVAAPHLVRAVCLSYYLGLRPGAVELLTLQWHHVNFDSGTILVVSAHKGGPEKRLVPIHEQFEKLLRQWRRADRKDKMDHIIHYRGRPIKKIQTAWDLALDRAGITRRIRPYDLRHHFVTRALEEGADIKALADIVGSRPETIVRHYQHVSRKLHRDTIAKIPPLKTNK